MCSRPMIKWWVQVLPMKVWECVQKERGVVLLVCVGVWATMVHASVPLLVLAPVRMQEVGAQGLLLGSEPQPVVEPELH